MNEKIAKIKRTQLGIEDHGILTAWLHLSYGGSGQGAGGYALDSYDEKKKRRVGHACGTDFILGVLRAVGVDDWERVAGRTIIAITDTEYGKVIGIKPLPTEKGETFMFADCFASTEEAS